MKISRSSRVQPASGPVGKEPIVLEEFTDVMERQVILLDLRKIISP